MKFQSFYRETRLWILLLFLSLSAVKTYSAETHPPVVKQLLERIGGRGTSERILTFLDTSVSTNGKETFVIMSCKGKPCVKGNTILAITTGINWYLNHYAHVNLSWNQMTTDLSGVALPLPKKQETRCCGDDCRYYLNYCTFSYSCTPWTWERWQKEIDWMALHGVNMPLVAVGMEAVWRDIILDLGYTEDDVNNFVPGPAYQAWWLMGNLQGAGKPNPKWWYAREAELCKKILSQERAFGMTPVLPGFAGLVPDVFRQKNTSKMTFSADIKDGGNWIQYTSPAMVDPNTSSFAEMANIFYKAQKKLMGTSKYYSMDLCHEGSGGTFLNHSSENKSKACEEVIKAMDANVGNQTQWIVQHWGANPFPELKKSVPVGRAIILDLYADATSDWHDSFGGHDMVFCLLSNFGGKVGLHGRLSRTVNEYYKCKKKFGTTTLRGVGATPEGIENNPILYDALFEMPWREQLDTKEWLHQYTQARYGTTKVDEHLFPAWQLLDSSVYGYKDVEGLNSYPNQGPCETVFCARPKDLVNSASTWGFCTTKGWNVEQVRFAAKQMLEAKKTSLANNANYQNDVVEVVRQTLSDYALPLYHRLMSSKNNPKTFAALSNDYLRLMLDVDSLLSSVPNCLLGKWTSQARAIVDEPVAMANGATNADRDWLEKNARLLITTWKEENSALADYSNRLWGGLIKDFYYPRWKKFLEAKQKGIEINDWYPMEYAWATSNNKQYETTPVGNASAIANSLFNKYFCQLLVGNTPVAIFGISLNEERNESLLDCSLGKKTSLKFVMPLSQTQVLLSVDYNNDGTFSTNETFTAVGKGTIKHLTLSTPNNFVVGKVKARIKTMGAVGTSLDFYVNIAH